MPKMKFNAREKKIALAGEVTHAVKIIHILKKKISDADKLREINNLSVGLVTMVSYR